MQYTVSRADISAADIRILRRARIHRPARATATVHPVHPRPLTRSYTRMAAAKATYIRKLEAGAGGCNYYTREGSYKQAIYARMEATNRLYTREWKLQV
jgi:hypothetical protein